MRSAKSDLSILKVSRRRAGVPDNRVEPSQVRDPDTYVLGTDDHFKRALDRGAAIQIVAIAHSIAARPSRSSQTRDQRIVRCVRERSLPRTRSMSGEGMRISAACAYARSAGSIAILIAARPSRRYRPERASKPSFTRESGRRCDTSPSNRCGSFSISGKQRTKCSRLEP